MLHWGMEKKNNDNRPRLVRYGSNNSPEGAWTLVREKEYKKLHDIFDGAPNEWCAVRGATHTLDCGEGLGRGTRPAKLLKTRLYVGVDENEYGDIVWEKWETRIVDSRDDFNKRRLDSHLATI